MGTLRSFGWSKVNGIDQYDEFVIDLDKVLYVRSYKDPSGGDSSLVALSATAALHLDVPLTRMQEILNEHKANPFGDFDTHPDFDKDKQGTPKASKNVKKKPRE